MCGNNSEVYPSANDVAAACDNKFVSAQLATVANIKAAPGNIYGYLVENSNATKSYLQIFKTLAANVTLGTTVPDFVIFVPATGAADAFAVVPILHSDVGLSMAATTTPTGNTAPGSGLMVNVLYK